MPDISKSIWQSKTFWTNVIVAGSALIAVPELQAVLPDNAMQYLVVAQSVANIGLRIISTQPVHVVTPQP